MIRLIISNPFFFQLPVNLHKSYTKYPELELVLFDSSITINPGLLTTRCP